MLFRIAMRSRALRAVAFVIAGSFAVALVTSGCGPAQAPPAAVADPAGVGIIASADLGGDAFRYAIDGDGRLDFPRNSTRTLESTGRSQPGDLLVHGEDATGTWIAIFRELEPDEATESGRWAAQGPAWIQQGAVVFDSGLRLTLAPDFTREPSAQPPGETGFVPAGTFLLDERAVVVALR